MASARPARAMRTRGGSQAVVGEERAPARPWPAGTTKSPADAAQRQELGHDAPVRGRARPVVGVDEELLERGIRVCGGPSRSHTSRIVRFGGRNRFPEFGDFPGFDGLSLAVHLRASIRCKTAEMS